MGNWRNRRRGGFYRQDRAPKFPPSYRDPKPSLSKFRNDGVPLWEKKFCASVGGMSWQKIVDAKKLMCYNEKVLNWDDSAGIEAFENAKKRYWAKTNGFTCDVPAPDPNPYIDEINWNPYIDPELIRYFGKKMARQNSKKPFICCSDKVGNPSVQFIQHN